MSAVLAQAARRLEANPQMMASALAAYRRQRGLDDAALAAWLALPPDRVLRLALCVRPDPARPAFAAAVVELAVQSGCAVVPLWQLLRTATGAGRPAGTGTAQPPRCLRGAQRPRTGMGIDR